MIRFILALIGSAVGIAIISFMKALELVFLLPIPLKYLEIGYSDAGWWDVIWPYALYKFIDIALNYVWKELTS